MTPEQHLYPEAIYRVNGVLEEACAKHPYLKHAWVLPSRLDTSTRTFRWLSVHPDNWELSDGMIKALDGRLVTDVPVNLDTTGKALWASRSDKARWPELHRHLLATLEGHAMDIERHDPRYIEGLMLQLCRRAAASPTADAQLFAPYLTLKLHPRTPGFPILELISAGARELRFFDQERGTFHAHAGEISPSDILTMSLREGRWVWRLQEVLSARNEETATRSHPWGLHVLPVFDAAFDQNLYGRLVATIIVSIADEAHLHASHEAVKLLAPATRLVAGALWSAKLARAAEAPITDAPTETPPLLDHFLRAIPQVQDWHAITVSRPGSSKTQQWNPKKQAYDACERPDSDRSMAERTLTEMLAPESVKEDELQELADVRLGFHYPDYAIVPDDLQVRELMERHYWRRLIEVWRIIKPKVVGHLRTKAQRLRAEAYARRAATAAIMGRNMSHNLGSHPLAAFTREGSVACAAPGDLAHMIRYVRDRMDYIAEVSTAQPSWMASFALRSVLDDFVGEKLILQHLTERQVTLGGIGEVPVDLAVGFPHGLIGVQALYSVLENCLRNSVRHGNTNECGRIEIVAERHRDLVAITLVDRGCECSDRAREEIAARLKAGFFMADATEQMDPQSWGLKEMKISAAFLRLRPPQLADGYADDAMTPGYSGTAGTPWIEPVCHAIGGERYLGWKLLMLRPRIALVVGLAGAERAGITYRDAIDSALVASHRFVVTAPERSAVLPLGLRAVTCTQPEWDALAARDDADLEIALYERWNAALAGPAGQPQLRIVDDSAPPDSPLALPEGRWLAERRWQALTRAIVFERHSSQGGVYKQWSRWESHDGLWNHVDVFCGFDGNTAGRALIEQARDGQRFAQQRLIEAGLVWIVVLDERLGATGQLEQLDQLARAGIVIPEIAEISARAIDPEDVCRHLQATLGARRPAFVLASVHHTIVMGLNKTVRDMATWIGRLATGLTAIGPSVVMVHSGRGVPPELREPGLSPYPFVEFSNIERWMGEPGSKALALEILLGACRSRGGAS